MATQSTYTATALPVDGETIDASDVTLWHDRLGHPGQTMMRRIMESTNGHHLKLALHKKDVLCVPCAQGKFVTRPSPSKLREEENRFLWSLHGDVCGPINPASGPFIYFMVLVDASSRWSSVCLLSSRNQAFAKFAAQIIKLRAQFPDVPIKSVRLDGAGEFTSKVFDDYCMTQGIEVEHPVAHVHTQNGMAESMIKRIQMISRPLLMQCALPAAAWGHAVLHAADLIRIRPSAQNKESPYELVFGKQPHIAHLRKFGCTVYVPILPKESRTKLGPQRRLGIYVGYISPSIIRYLEPLTGDLFTARFADCQFDEKQFPTLGGVKAPEERREITWESNQKFLDPVTRQRNDEVQRLIHLQGIANELPDAFNNAVNVTKSHHPVANVPARILPPSQSKPANESSP